MSEVKKWHMPRGTSISEGEDGEFVLASDYDALTGRYECNTAIMRARTKALDRVTAERDAALAELAALKGGQEPVMWVHPNVIGADMKINWPTAITFSNRGPCHGWTFPLYAAPPAQASAWVPVSERLPELEQNVLVEFTTIHGTPQHTTATLHRISQHCGPDTPYHNRWFVTVGNGHELHTVTRWQPIAAPTPGASDGKGGDV